MIHVPLAWVITIWVILAAMALWQERGELRRLWREMGGRQ